MNNQVDSNLGKVDFDRVACQLLRALRGRRSQVAFARRLGYRSNPIAKWEGGHRFPTAAETFRACAVVGVDASAAAAAFHPAAAGAWRADAPGAWLAALKGDTPQARLAARSGLSRQQVGRALRGDSQPRLPAFLALVEAAPGRAADWVALLVDIAAVPALAREVAARRAVRRLAFDHPWSPAALAILEALPPGAPAAEARAALAARLPLDAAAVEALWAAIEASGALAGVADRPALTVDVAPTREEHRALRAHWAAASAARVASPAPADVFSFNVFAVSREDLAHLQALQRAFFREARGVIAGSRPEVAAFMTLHTAALE